jgi:hypothetical protein
VIGLHRFGLSDGMFRDRPAVHFDRFFARQN